MKYEDAKRLQKSIKSVYIINDYEEIKFYLESGPYKRGNLDFNNFDDIRYNLYLELNKVLIDKSDYIVIQPNTMDFVTDNIISYILYYNRINSDGISRTRY